MGTRIADHWFENERVDDDITLLWEPHVDPLIRCNIWHVRGRTRDLMIDTGLGLASLKEAARHLLEKPVIALATHTHYDHMGSMHEFEVRAVHRIEAGELAAPSDWGRLRGADFSDEMRLYFDRVGYPIPEELVTAYPHEGFDPARYATPPAAPTWLLDDGDVVDLGNRAFEVFHLPGHSPGSIGLWEGATGTLFSGDAVYDGPLLDELPGSDVEAYLGTMRRLRELPVSVVHGGHEPSFGRARLIELVEGYLKLRS
ncbi:MAG: MBL fold metallo-hydrolase [Alphaproteobacteria bacterium]|nr:MBL fold metallo-hydrolase [Pseudomonadota bacterium]